jgi:hypothetical protein
LNVFKLKIHLNPGVASTFLNAFIFFIYAGVHLLPGTVLAVRARESR